MTSAPNGSSPERYLEVAAIRTVADRVLALTLHSPDGSDLPPWTPGAHIDVRLGPGLVRQYSLCGHPADAATWMIAVQWEPRGRGGSDAVHSRLREGDLLPVRGPRNTFELVDADSYVFVVGGIGVTPIVSMVRAVRDRGKPWRLLYGGRSRRSMAFVEVLSSLRGGGSEVRIVPEDEHGPLDLTALPGPAGTDPAVYCCGPPSLIDAVERACVQWRAASVHVERFAPPATPTAGESATESDGAFEVRLARSGRRLTVPGGTSLLEALEDAGFDITNSCRAGICGTCLIDVVEGRPEHLDVVLADAERDGGDVMLPCVSRARDEVLVLDR